MNSKIENHVNEMPNEFMSHDLAHTKHQVHTSNISGYMRGRVCTWQTTDDREKKKKKTYKEQPHWHACTHCLILTFNLLWNVNPLSVAVHTVFRGMNNMVFLETVWGCVYHGFDHFQCRLQSHQHPHWLDQPMTSIMVTLNRAQKRISTFYTIANKSYWKWWKRATSTK